MNPQMKAAVLENWQSIKVQEVDIPEPGSGMVLIKVSYAGICGSDVHIFNGDNPIAKAPVIQGHEFMGVIAKKGDGVDGFCLGDRVVVQPLVYCGHCPPCKQGIPHVCHNLVVVGVNQDGAFAEYVVVPVDTLFPLPDSLSDEAAALAEPFSIGFHSCRRGGLAAGEQVLVTGAGPIGLYAAIVAREIGASHVVISEPNKARREFSEKLGIKTLDPNNAHAVDELLLDSNNGGFQLVIETSGVDAGLEFASQAVAVQGRIVTLGFPAKNYSQYNITRGIVKEVSLIGSRVCTRSEFAETLELLSNLNNQTDFNLNELTTSPRTLQHVVSAIADVECGNVCEKILIKPS